jgi:hypothetical protein
VVTPLRTHAGAATAYATYPLAETGPVHIAACWHDRYASNMAYLGGIVSFSAEQSPPPASATSDPCSQSRTQVTVDRSRWFAPGPDSS